MLSTATGAAAATGSLPDAAQTRIAAIASHGGIDLPAAGDAPGAGESDRPSTEQPVGIDSSGPGVSDGTAGSVVSGVATGTDLEGSEKGHQIADTAKEQGGAPEGVEPGRPEGQPTESKAPPPPVEAPAPADAAQPTDDAGRGAPGPAPAAERKAPSDTPAAGAPGRR